MYDWIPLAYTVLYTLVLLFGLMVAVPMGITKEHFDGECVLYGRLVASLDWLKFGDVSNCNYVIFVHVVISVLLGFVMAAAFIFVLISEFRGNTIQMRTNFFVSLAQLVVHCLATFLAFICACILSVGFKRLCDNIEKYLPTCSDAQRLNWRSDVNGGDFHDNTQIALAAAWCNLAVWILLIALSTYVLVSVRQGSYPPGVRRTTTTTTTTTRSMSGSRTTVKSTSSSQKAFSIA